MVIALPPYLTTTVWPLREEMEEAIVMAFSAKDDEESEEKSDVDVLTDFWCRGNDDDDDIDGSNACDVLAIVAARRMMLLAENSFMVVMIVYWICATMYWMVGRYEGCHIMVPKCHQSCICKDTMDMRWILIGTLLYLIGPLSPPTKNEKRKCQKRPT